MADEAAAILEKRKDLAKGDGDLARTWAIAGWGALAAYQTGILDQLTGLDADELDKRVQITRNALKTHFILDDGFLADAKLSSQQRAQKIGALRASLQRAIKIFEKVVVKVLDVNLIGDHLKAVNDVTAKQDNGWKPKLPPAYTWAGALLTGKKIRITSAFEAITGPKARAAMILHESAHYVDPENAFDIYEHGDKYSKMSSHTALRNASSYAAFAIHVAERQDARWGAAHPNT